MAASKELITKIVLKAQADGSISKAFKSLSDHTDTATNKLKKMGDTAKKACKIVAGAVAGAAVASAKAAIDFESAFAGVQKTVDETKTTSYEDLSNGIRQLAKETPAAATEIANVAASAGQLGIKADDILKFSKTMIDLGESTNLTSEDAATSIAKLFNVTGTSMDKVQNFGSTLVALGNNAATTESDILAMATRIAASGSQVGLTEQQILALSTSLSSVGLEAEAGGTAISTTISQIDKDVALNSENLEIWAKTAGMSTSQFSQAWKKDAYGALQKVIKGMSTTKDEGGNLNILLEELGINGIRQGDSLKRLAKASGLLSDMTNLANESWSENAALTKEANTRYQTTAARLAILKNKVTDVMITVGEKLLPVVNNIIDKMDEVNWDEVAQKIVNKVQWVIDNFDKIKVALSILGVAFATFKVASFINTVSGAVKELTQLSQALGLTTKLSKFASMLKKSAVAQKLVTAAQWLWNASLWGCPILLIVGLIAGLVAAFVILWKKCDGFRNFWIGLWEKIKTAASAVGNWIKNFFTVTIPNAFNKFISFCKSIGQAIANFFTVTIPNAFKSVVTFFTQLPSRIGAWLSGVWQKITAWGANLWNKAKEIGRNFVNGVIDFFSQLPYRIGYIIGYCIGKIILFGQKLWSFVTTTIPQFIGKVVDWFKQLPGKIWTWLVNVVTKIGQWGTNMYAKAKAAAIKAVNAVVNFFKTLPGKVWTWLTNTISKITAWGAKMLSVAKQKASQTINAVINWFKQLPGKVWTWLTNTIQKVISWGSQMVAKAKQAATDTFNAVVNKIKEIPGKMAEIGSNIVKGIWNGIKNAKDWLIGRIKSFAKGITDGIKKALGINSPSVVMEKLFKWVPVGAGIGIEKNTKYAVNAIKNMGGEVNSAAGKINPTLAVGATKLQKFGTGGTVTSPQTAIVGDKPETIVPHGNTPRNRALLQEAARGVGAKTGGNTFSFTFAPVINGGNAEENRAMLRDEEEVFEQQMNAWIARNRRLVF